MIAWGQVTAVETGYVSVRIAGDTTDVDVTRQNADVTLTTGDLVVLLRLGPSTWSIAYVDEAVT